jgi:hypothetical protein
MQMSYIVTHGAAERHAPAGIDISPRSSGFTLEQALARACQLLAEGMQNVVITDGAGHEISGADLAACCRGEKTLTPDLRAN